MIRFARLLLILCFSVFTLNTFATDKNYPFKVSVSGKGTQSILFIPGFASSGEVWDETITYYQQRYNCHVLTMPGFAGISPASNPTFTSWEVAIAEYIRNEQLHKPIVVGHSMGGGLAMAIAADYPDLISGIVVVDALPYLAALYNPSAQVKENNDCTGVVSKMMAMSDEQFYQMQKNNISRLVADTAKAKLVEKWSLASDRKTFARMFCDFSNTDLREKIIGIKCPALILLESYFINFQPSIDNQFKNLKTAQIKYATKGLHFIMYDDKQWFLEQLNVFVNQ